ncbi:MAG: response regulator transcription factor [Eubacterium sp.]|nr:response regulator transcription factor [Eubacterium sp.]
MAERILIVEDEEKIARFIELELKHEGYEVSKCTNGREGLAEAEQGGYDLMLLDIMLPELNGFEVLRRLRRTSALPVILLTARDAVMDKVAGLDGGADDYITKPFAIEELLARIRLVLKKAAMTGLAGGVAEKNSLGFGELTMDTQRYEVRVAGRQVELTNREFELLKILLENKNIVMTREVLLNRVCGYDYLGETNMIDVYIRYLRSKIDERFGIRMIQTVRGVGYVIREERPEDE